MRKLILLLVLLSVVLSISVSARRDGNFSEDDAYAWLIDKRLSSGSYNNDIEDTAMALLAVDAADGSVNLERDYIISQENSNHCWPKSGCRIKPTSWAMRALYQAGETSGMDDIQAWLKKAQSPGLTTGNWFLEIDTPDSGTCTIKYNKGTVEVSKTITVEEGVFPSCGGTTFFNLKNCLESGLLNNYASLELAVDCDSLSSAKISIAYNSGSAYYLYDEVADKTATLVVKNGCFGKTYKSTCDYESSLYSEWILSQMGSSLSSELYLRTNYDSGKTIHNALLYLTTQDKIYATNLKKSQKTDGSWDTNSLNTAFAVLALRDEGEYSQYVEKAKEWLKMRQQEDGSWNGKVLNTAMVLYSAFTQAELPPEPSCSDYMKNQGERGIDCGGPCEEDPYYDDCCYNDEMDDGEAGVDCGGVCENCTTVDICNSDGVCDVDLGENCTNCAVDCLDCEDDICDSDGFCDINLGENCTNCASDCPSCEEDICDGNGVCDLNLSESCNNCPADCLSCEDLCSNGQEDDASHEEGVDCGGYCDECVALVCDNDGYCDENQGEGCNNCPADCLSCEDLCSNGQKDTSSDEEGVDCGGYCDPCKSEVCNQDGNCEYDLTEKYTDYTSNEDRLSCPNDCYCGDGICDDDEKDKGDCSQDCGASLYVSCGDGNCGEGEDISCPEDCSETVCDNDGICEFELDESCSCEDCAETSSCVEESSSKFKWIVIMLIILALGGISYFYLTKKKSKPKKSLYNLYSGRGIGSSPSSSKAPSKPKGKGSFFSSFSPSPKSSAAPKRQTFKPLGSRKSKKTKLDNAIEDSIKEAKKLIKGEK